MNIAHDNNLVDIHLSVIGLHPCAVVKIRLHINKIMCNCKNKSTNTYAIQITGTKSRYLSSTEQPCEFSVIRSGTPGALVSPTGTIQPGQNCCCDLTGFVKDGKQDKYKRTTWPTLLLQRSRLLFSFVDSKTKQIPKVRTIVSDNIDVF